MNLTAVILCGGKGTRLHPVIGDSLPKCLAPVMGRPFLSYVLDHLKSQGIENVVLCCQRKDVEYFRFVLTDPERIFPCWEDEYLGTVGALKNAFPLIDSDPVLVLNGDTFCPFDLLSLMMAYKQNGFTSDCGSVEVRSGSSPVGVGIYLIDKEIIEGLDSSLPLEKALWMDKENTKMFLTSKPFLDIGTPEGYKKAEQFLREVIGG